jgi:hypothetical protein
MITIVCFLWQPAEGVQRYTAKHVNALRRGLERYLSLPHRLVCVTDHPEGLDWRIRVVAPDNSLPKEKRYRKLMLFHPEAGRIFGGERLLGIDLDVTPVGELDALFNRPEDFVIWRDPLSGREGYSAGYRYNSSLILMDAGCRPQVYERMESAEQAHEAIRAVQGVGSDQAWIGAVLGPDEAVWTRADGVLGYKHDILPNDPAGRTWPKDARLIVSHGKPKPWGLDPEHPLRVAYERNAETEAVA